MAIYNMRKSGRPPIASSLKKYNITMEEVALVLAASSPPAPLPTVTDAQVQDRLMTLTLDDIVALAKKQIRREIYAVLRKRISTCRTL